MPLDTHTGFMVAASSVAFGAYFMAVKKTFKLPTKRLAWVLPTASALILGSLSLYELHRLGTLGWDLNRLAFTDSPVSRWGISIFLSSLLTDCFFGTLYYLDQFDPLSGWAHHAFYIGATLYALQGNFTSGVLIFMTSEFPTFILAMGHVMPQLRSDLGFGLSFLATRILYHAWLSYKTLMLTNPAYEVRWCVVLPMILHVWWFDAWVKGQVRRMKKGAVDKKEKLTAAEEQENVTKAA